MDKNSKRSIAFILLAGLIFPALNSQAVSAVEDRVNKSFTVDIGGTLLVDVDRGSIDLTAVPGNELKIEVIRNVDSWTRRRGEDVLKVHKVEISQQGNDVRIYSRHKGARWSIWPWRRTNLKVRYVISTPAKYDADLRTAGGSISVGDLSGRVKARTSGGGITLQSCRESADVETSGGSLRISEVEGPVVAKTSGGSIEITQVKGNVLARTSGGSIRVAGVSGKVDASTSGGSVTAHLSSQPGGDCTLKTSGGSIDVRLAEKIAVDLDASTSGGQVVTDFPVAVQGKLKRNVLKSKVNGGGPVLSLHTSGGNVHIRRL